MVTNRTGLNSSNLPSASRTMMATLREKLCGETAKPIGKRV